MGEANYTIYWNCNSASFYGRKAARMDNHPASKHAQCNSGHLPLLLGCLARLSLWLMLTSTAAAKTAAAYEPSLTRPAASSARRIDDSKAPDPSAPMSTSSPPPRHFQAHRGSDAPGLEICFGLHNASALVERSSASVALPTSIQGLRRHTA